MTPFRLLHACCRLSANFTGGELFRNRAGVTAILLVHHHDGNYKACYSSSIQTCHNSGSTGRRSTCLTVHHLSGTSLSSAFHKLHFHHSVPQNSQSSTSVTLTDVFSDTNKQQVVRRLKNRRWGLKSSDNTNHLQRSAVLVPLCTVQGVPSIVLTKRSSKLIQNRGQVSFPGGKADDADLDVTDTALRETSEEIGIPPRCVDVWTQLAPSLFPLIGRRADKNDKDVELKKSHMSLTPVVGFCGELDLQALRVNREEVSEVFACSLESFCNPNFSHYTWFRTGAGAVFPVYTGGPYRIWGATALILHAVLKALLHECYPLSLKPPNLVKRQS